MQLRQTEVVGALDNNGVGSRNIDTGFDDSGTHQHVEALMVEIIHHPFQLALAHLTVADGDTCFWHQFRQLIGGFLDVLDVVEQVVHLAAAQGFTENRFAHHQAVVFADEGFDRQTTRRRGSDN